MIRYYYLHPSHAIRIDSQNKYADWDFPLPDRAKVVGTHVHQDGSISLIVLIPDGTNDAEPTEDKQS